MQHAIRFKQVSQTVGTVGCFCVSVAMSYHSIRAEICNNTETTASRADSSSSSR